MFIFDYVWCDGILHMYLNILTMMDIPLEIAGISLCRHFESLTVFIGEKLSCAYFVSTSRAEQSRAEQSRAEQSRAEIYYTLTNRIIPNFYSRKNPDKGFLWLFCV